MIKNATKNDFYEKWIEKRQSAPFSGAPFGHILTQPDGKIFKINNTLLEWLEMEEAEILHKKTFQNLLTIGGQIYYETHHFALENLQGFAKEINYNLKGSGRKRTPGRAFPCGRCEPASR